MSLELSKKAAAVKPSSTLAITAKAKELREQGKDVVGFGAGEPDFNTPDHICDAAIDAIRAGFTKYTPASGTNELKEAVCKKFKQFNGLEYQPDQIVISNGGKHSLTNIFTALLNPGDEVLIPQPSYVSYEPCAILAGAKPVIIDLKAENEFRLTAQELEEVITDRSKVLILPYPNNPTGAIMEREDLEAIAEVIRRHDLIVMSDEIYGELTYKGKHVSIASLPGMKERTILINGFSKAYAMTGWRLGYACGPTDIIGQMTKIHQFAIMCAPTTSQYAAVEALKNGDDDIAEMCKAYNQRRRYLLHAFREMGLECFEPYGAFYVFPCIRQFGMTSDEFASRFLAEEKVAVVPGTAFGDSGEGFLRISYAYSLENLKVAIARLERFVKKLRDERS